jgi:hypothetical protein
MSALAGSGQLHAPTAFLVTEFKCGDPSASRSHGLSHRTDLVAPTVKITPRHGPPRNTPFRTVPLLLRVDSLLPERLYRDAASKCHWYIRLPRGRRLLMALHGTIF